MAETSKSERRRNKRVSFIKEVELVGVGMRRCSDLGIDGMYIETVASFPIGTVLDLRFKLQETDDYPIQVQTQVLYEHESMVIGLGFVNLSPENREKIHKFIDQH